MGVGDAHFDGTVHPQSLTTEWDASSFLVAVDPGAKSDERLWTFGERKSPFVDELTVQTVHEQRILAGLDSGHGVGARLEAVLHAEDEPFYPREDAGNVVGEVEQIVVEIVPEFAAVEGGFGRTHRFVGPVGRPNDSTI